MNTRMSVMFAVAMVAVFAAGITQPAIPELDVCGAPVTSTLMTGSGESAGKVIAANSDDTLYVHFAPEGDWQLMESDLHAGSSRRALPSLADGSPDLADFAYQSKYGLPVTGDVYEIPLDEWTPGTEVVIAAHAVLVQGADEGAYDTIEVGWGGRSRFGEGRAAVIEYTVQACDN